jgi:hypothetical protein
MAFRCRQIIKLQRNQRAVHSNNPHKYTPSSFEPTSQGDIGRVGEVGGDPSDIISLIVPIPGQLSTEFPRYRHQRATFCTKKVVIAKREMQGHAAVGTGHCCSISSVDLLECHAAFSAPTNSTINMTFIRFCA